VRNLTVGYKDFNTDMIFELLHSPLSQNWVQIRAAVLGAFVGGVV
jgi:hypothetical protein